MGLSFGDEAARNRRLAAASIRRSRGDAAQFRSMVRLIREKEIPVSVSVAETRTPRSGFLAAALLRVKY
jgi:hypothetical protein